MIKIQKSRKIIRNRKNNNYRINIFLFNKDYKFQLTISKQTINYFKRIDFEFALRSDYYVVLLIEENKGKSLKKKLKKSLN
jgi:hypothetical protein